MGDEQDRPPLSLELRELVNALFLKVRIANSQNLIYQQNLRMGANSDGERQPDTSEEKFFIFMSTNSSSSAKSVFHQIFG